jgi:hypothetical protein
MLNHESDRRIGIRSEWCVGEPPVRWDVSFGERLAEKIRQIFWRDGGDRQVIGRVGVVNVEKTRVRKAA